jgi:hypothetical protein
VSAVVNAPATPADSPLTLDDVLASPLYGDLSTPKLAPGDPAFDFELELLDARGGANRRMGRTVRLSDFAGERPVALVFGSYT